MTTKKNNTQSPLFAADQVEKNIQLETVFEAMLPHLRENFSEWVAAHLLVVLKMEGYIGQEVGPADLKLVETIKANLFKDKRMQQEFYRMVASIKKEQP